MATQLLLESYATKGFHNKAKSCPWGPMAGFVMADPRFTKNPDVSGQRTDLYKAAQSGASETPLYITEERRRTLEELHCMTAAGGTINEKIYTARSPKGDTMKFVLKRTLDAPGADGKQLWAVFYHQEEVRLSNSLTAPNRGGPSNLLPVMAMVDPACPSAVRRTYRAATTGDYDLFAVFPPRTGKGRYNPKDDRRMVPGSDRFKVPLSEYEAHEDPHRGNLTGRIIKIRGLINDRVRAIGYKGGDVVHHSDEAGRPKVSSIDFPFIAFVPKQSPYCVQNVSDFKKFIMGLQWNWVITLNPGWHRELGISVSAGGSYTV